MGFMEAISRRVVFVIEELPENAENLWEQSKIHGKPCPSEKLLVSNGLRI